MTSCLQQIEVCLYFICLQNSEVRSQFQEFLSLNGHQLEQRPFPDVVQLALSQPHNSSVYRQARLRAQKLAKAGKLYFDLAYESKHFNMLSFHNDIDIDHFLTALCM